MLDRSNNAFNFIPIRDMNKLEILGMPTYKSLFVLKEVAERTNCLLKTTKEARSTISRCLKVTNYTKNLIHKSLLLVGLGKIP